MQSLARHNRRHMTTSSQLRWASAPCWIVPRPLVLWLALAVILVAGHGVAQADRYRLDTGDILRVTVYGEDGYPLEVSVDDTGGITLPLLGEVEARGRTAGDLAAAIEEAFRAREILRNPFVQIAVQEYRPFFISGAVARPGAYPYKPRMTVRHAIAIAGGFKAISVGDKAPALTIADLKSDRTGYVIELFRHETLLKRLEAELAGRDSFGLPGEIPTDLPPELIEQIVANEESQMAARKAKYQQEVQNLEAVVTEAEQKARSVALARGKTEMVASDQLKELEGARSLRGKGLMTKSDLLGAERAYNTYLANLAQMDVQASKEQQDLFGRQRELEGLHSTRRIDIISQIQETQIAAAKARNRIRYISDQLAFISTYGEHRSLEELSGSLKIVIHSPTNGDAPAREADEDTPVEAGDIVDINVLADSAFYGIETSGQPRLQY